MKKLWSKRIIDVYIIKEVLYPFLIGVSIIGVIMLSGLLRQLSDLIIIKKIPVAVVLKLLLYQLPEIIVQTFPIAILFATMSGMGRLNRENEFTALRMGGISLYRLILPLLILGIVISGMTYLLNEEIVPWTKHRAQNIIRKSVLKEVPPDIKENVFFKGPDGRLFYVGRFDKEDNIMKKIVVYTFKGDNGYPLIVTANLGEVYKEKWVLKKGFIHRYNGEGHLTMETRFDVMEIKINTEVHNFFADQKTPDEMSREELKKEIDLFQNSGIDVHSLLVDYHLKLSMPLAALIFILIGTPLSLTSKDSRSFSIIFTIVVVFLYYFVMSLSRSFGRNGRLDPVLAAWLPNIIFSIIGITLLIWRESWRNLLRKLLVFLPVFFIIMLIFFPSPASAGSLKLKADNYKYHGFEEKLVEITGDVSGEFGKLYLIADRVTIKQKDGSEDIDSSPQEVIVSQTRFTGCDLDKPHYFFRAREVIIYPDDHLEAKHVTFWELNGKLPLFYWPYLYISLKEKTNRLIPRVGHNARRGWFVKATYYYWYKKELPGELYIDYYTRSGYAGGFKQYLVYRPDLKASVYFYSQENREKISGLFDWQGALEYYDNIGSWKTDTDLKYTRYDNYHYTRGHINLSNNEGKGKLNLASSFDSRDYFTGNTDDDINLDVDFSYRYNFGSGWYINLIYNRDYLLNPEDGLKSRWGSKSYLQKTGNKYKMKLLLERYDPKLSAEDEVSFYRWPELSYNYTFGGGFSGEAVFGNYYEDDSGIEGYRASGGLNYYRKWSPIKKTRVTFNQGIKGRYYRVKNTVEEDNDVIYSGYSELPYLFSYDSRIGLNIDITSRLELDNTYSYTWPLGATPFNFDEVKPREEIRNKLTYQKGDFDFELKGGFDIYNYRYLPISAILEWQITPDWEVSAGTTYDLNNNSYGTFALKSKYSDGRWLNNTALTFDPDNNKLMAWDSKLTYELEENWYVEVNASFDYVNNDIKQANLAVKKDFHCRELWFAYDYLKEEFTVEYRLDLFPDQGFKFGTSREESFMFDVGIKDLLGIN
ncbi:YjgP/YjgQ family permease [Halothermothrix orenii]|uniref:Permease YjgP/YjgQ family protein n=1 Tax=Halothermothrix orenii (strain H 168 / OCM 544 / DSM 9562) TaxID=373903 RepID=B8CYZ1_HALOH|nr:YjgP/YjgQ family permease [Halothermothrix orenii]ACL70510.1 permease YjgP/YjgQ family protein [Halothermothrix orenii H 168]